MPTRVDHPCGAKHALARSVAILALLAGCSAGTPSDDVAGQSPWSPPVAQPPAPKDVKEMFTFEDLREMVATAPTVIEGRVIDVVEGRTFGDPGAGIQMSRALVEVTDHLAGDPVASQIALEESGVFGPFFRPGDAAIMFIYPMDPDRETKDNYYGWIGSQGRFLYTGDGRLESMNDALAWIQEIEQMSPAQLKESIAQAVADIEAGSV